MEENKYDFLIHPAAELFPAISEDELRALAEDIRLNGQLHPIALFKGSVLDGRNRLKACKLLGIPPLTKNVTPEDPYQYVISQNLHRRHLTTEQRATIAAELATRKPGAQPGNANASETNSSKEPVVPTPTIAQAAKLMNVSPASVKRAGARMRKDPEAHSAAKVGTNPKSPNKNKARPVSESALETKEPQTVPELLKAMCPACRKKAEEMRALLREQWEKEVASEGAKSPGSDAPPVSATLVQ